LLSLFSLSAPSSTPSSASAPSSAPSSPSAPSGLTSSSIFSSLVFFFSG
jgi:hypothetical protein